MAHRSYRRPRIDLWWIPGAIYSIRRFIAQVRSVIDVFAPRPGRKRVSDAGEDQLEERRHLFFPGIRKWLGANVP